MRSRPGMNGWRRIGATSLRQPSLWSMPLCSTGLLLLLAATCDAAGRHPWGVTRARLMPVTRQSHFSRSSAGVLAAVTVRGGSRDETSSAAVEPGSDEELESSEDETPGNTQPQLETDDADESLSSETDEQDPPVSEVSSEKDAQVGIVSEEGSDDAESNEEKEEAGAESVEPSVDLSPETMHPTVVETTTTTVLQPDLADLANEIDAAVSESLEKESKVQEPTKPLTREQIDKAIEVASQLRTEGKELHDNEQYSEAATKFSNAANLLFPILADDDSVADDFATCRLHQALCFLKAEEYDQAIQACTDVLDLPPTTGSVEPALRARAFHRRAKAQVELGDEEAALQDARSAAFLGDRKAVALYGKLMRGSGGASSSSLIDGSSSASDLEASTALFESLLNKSSGSMPSLSGSSTPPGMGEMGSMFPSSLFDMMGAASGGAKGDGNGGPGGLAKSVLSSLSKRLEDESTQDQICNYLQGTSGPQLKQMASMAGIQLQEGQANRLASFAQGVTPKTIRRTLRTTKTAYYVIQLIRRIFKVIAKYRSIIILLIIVGWIRSALNRPFPINKKAARLAAKEAAKAAANAAKEATVTVVTRAAGAAVDAM